MRHRYIETDSLKVTATRSDSRVELSIENSEDANDPLRDRKKDEDGARRPVKD